MPCVFLPLVARLPRSIARRLLPTTSLAALALLGLTGGVTAAPPAGLAGSGVATIPADAAFLSSSLRIREQYDRLLGSNAFAAIRELPGVSRAYAAWDEQQEIPGSPVSMFLTFLELPENEQAAELLSDMVASDTFVYGTASCVKVVRLVRELQRAQQAASFLDGAAEGGILDIQEFEMIEKEDAEAGVFPDGFTPVNRQVELDFEVMPTAGMDQAAAILKALAENPDLIVVPDVVWGFKTSKPDIAKFQIRRLEVLTKMLVETNPALAGSLARRTITGGEIVTFTLDGDLLPWDDIASNLEEQYAAEADLEKPLQQVIDRVRDLNLVVTIGLVGDWVILSLGDSADHLEDLVLPGGKGKAAIDTPAFAPLLAHADKTLTGISYMSQQFVEALAASPKDLDPLLANVEAAAEAQDLPPQAAADARAWLKRAQTAYGEWLPRPGDWMSFSFLGENGYEGYTWNWSQNQPFDGKNRLDLLDHAGGTPLAVFVGRLKSNPGLANTLGQLARDAWALVTTYGRERMDDEDRPGFDRFADEFVPLLGQLMETLEGKLGRSLADGQFGMVLDAQATTRKPQEKLPSAAEPLPLLEPAILLPLADRKLFIEGLNDLFALGDEFVARIRKLEPDAVPADYRIPEPEKLKLEQGTVWSFALTGTGLDEQIQPAIVVGDDVVAFTLVPGQAPRLLAAKPVETAANLADFAQPLIGVAAIDVARFVDAIEPWVVYLTRYGSVQQREGDVDPSLELTAGTETPEVAEALDHVKVVLEVARCLRAAAATTAFEKDAIVTHWRNEIQDLPAK